MTITRVPLLTLGLCLGGFLFILAHCYIPPVEEYYHFPDESYCIDARALFVYQAHLMGLQGATVIVLHVMVLPE